jgi:hypothetical protein
MHRLGLDLAVPDHTTLSRRARRLNVDATPHSGTDDLHLIVDRTGLKLRGAGDWLQDKHGTGGKRGIMVQQNTQFRFNSTVQAAAFRSMIPMRSAASSSGAATSFLRDGTSASRPGHWRT